ncbi:hypothetical protein [Kaistella jeonii]|uniref:Uncharacterized protein n=1 Tax=Kaistella jeonii TaxID=266749 RepID=A0A0C1F481_9FLAO|nr:hypothetical protein [Kaistella jeonii]KIA87957.1 hypothetical protein OA86_12980 [Kaistella jeonii]SFC07617.1 hypothetical protein SAMN05421876_1064 [Kaistella jeonii]VEI95132.1 Uncharacterised protein [Kaistella jeonii]
MRLNNRSRIGLYHFLSTLVIMIFLVGVLAFFLERYFYDYLDSSSVLFLIIPTLILLVFYFRGRQIFEYDSDGEALIFKNRNIFPFLNKATTDEFPKYKLLKYEILDLVILRRLYITISSKKNNSIILKYDISYLKKKELNDLKFSLSKVIKANKEREKS